MHRISVVFPQPDGPSRPVMLPRAIRTEKSCRAGRLPRITRQVADVDCRFVAVRQ